MTRYKAMLLGLATAWPLLYALGLFALALYATLHIVAYDRGPLLPGYLLPIHVATIMLVMGLLFYYVCHASRSSDLSDEKRTLWIVLLLFAGLVTMPVYWHVNVWSRKAR